MAGEGIQQADSGTLWLVEQKEEAFRGEGEHVVVAELGDVHLDALAGGGVEEGAASGCGVFLPKHRPPPRMEPAVEAAVRSRIHGASLPLGAGGTETGEVDDVVIGEDAVGDESRRPVRQISPVPRSSHQIGIGSQLRWRRKGTLGWHPHEAERRSGLGGMSPIALTAPSDGCGLGPIELFTAERSSGDLANGRVDGVCL